jgi:arylsulfatase A-like enzyme
MFRGLKVLGTAADESCGMRGPRGKVAIIGVLVCALMSAATGSMPGAAGATREATAHASRPNILLIISDDQASSTFSRALMPSVYSQLVDHGVLFKRAYVDTSLCCPSRAQILTGLYEHDTGVDANEVALDRPTFPMALHDAGYRTMLAGKYLNSWPCEPRPEFDRWICVGTPEPSTYSLVDPYMNVDGKWQRFSGYQPDILAAKAEDFIADTQSSRPFFVMYAPTTPHIPADDPRYDSMPVTPPRSRSFDFNTMTRSSPKYARRPAFTPGEIATSDEKYVAMAHATRSLDDAVGSLVSSLGDRSRDTIVVYLSDNGFLYGEHRRFGKTDPWEESVRIPMVVRYPAVHAEDQPIESDALVENVDIAATVADLAGVRWGADGTSFLPVLQGRERGGRKAVLIENCRGVSRGTLACSGLTFDGGTADAPGFEGIVTERYKYVEFDDGSRLLVDLKKDPHELRNLNLQGGRRGLELHLAARLHAMMRPRLQTTIASGPGQLAARAADFSYFSPSRTATYRCRLIRDGSADPWRSCPGGSVSYGQLEDGNYMFEVAGISEDGRIDPTAASRRFTVSTGGGPDIVLTAHPPLSQTDPTVSFSYSSPTPGAGFRCALMPLGPVPCDGSGVRFDKLGEASYRFEVWARDPTTGAVSDPGVGWDFRIDSTGPKMTFYTAPHGSTRRSDAVFRFFPDEAVVGPISCATGGEVVGCSGGRLKLHSLAVGPHRLVVTARDTLGNVGRTIYAWTIDRDAPIVRITAGPPRRLASTNATFFLSSSEAPGLFECQLDDLPVMPCFEAELLPDLSTGPHVFTVWSIDGAMNRSVADVYRWSVR